MYNLKEKTLQIENKDPENINININSSSDSNSDYLSREKFIESNLGLVHSCANRFRNRGIEYDDLFSAGCMGLVKAADSFDSGRGFKFSTYAVPVILGEIKRLFRDGGSVKVSRSLKELSLKISRERNNFISKNYREPTVSELAEITGLNSDDIIEALNVSMPVMSLTADPDEGNGQIDVRIEAPENEITDMLSLQKVISTLEPKDRKLIILRYFRGKTQSETANMLDMTQVQVSRREKKILTALRQMLS